MINFGPLWKKISSSSNKFKRPNQSGNSGTKSSTEINWGSGKSGNSGTLLPDLPELPEPPGLSVDDYHKSQTNDKYLTRETVVGSDSRYRAEITVYRVGEVEKVEGVKVVKRARLKFVLKYAKVVTECVDDCRDAVKVIAKASSYKIPAKALSERIAELRERYSEEEEISIVDYVREKYPDRLAEIERDPFKWILERTKEIVGYERLKLLTLLALVSSQTERVTGMSRVHIMLVGPSGAGKSSTVKSVLRFIDGTGVYIPGTRLTPNALGYLDIESFDGKVLFIEQIDRQNINYLREMMTEEKVCTLVTEKVVDEFGRERFVTRLHCIPGQAVVITTSVADDIDVERDQLFNRFLKVYVNPRSVDVKKVIEAIWTRTKSELSEVDRLVFLAYLLSRPKYVDNRDALERAKRLLVPIAGLSREPINRTAEVLRNLVNAVAIARGKTRVEDEDFDFVMRNFQLDILYNGLGLTERDVEFILTLPDDGSLKTSQVADELRVNKQYALNVLKNLERKGIVEGDKVNEKTFTWSLTPLGKRIKALVGKVDEEVVEVKNDKGEVVALLDTKFRPDSDGSGNREDAVPANVGGGVSKDEGEADRGAEASEPSDDVITFKEFVRGNNGMTLTFSDIYASFLDKEKAKMFLDWCLQNGYCVQTDNGYRIRAPTDRLTKAYEHLKRSGWVLVEEFVNWYGEEVFEALKRKDMLAFNEKDGKLYVTAK